MKAKGIKVGIEKDEKGHPIFHSITQARNWLKGLKGRLKKKAKAEDFPITTAGHPERLRFLMYGLSLLNPEDHPPSQRGQIMFYKNLLTAIAQGHDKRWIAKKSNCSLETLEKHEREAKMRVQDAILKAQKQGIPIFEG